jgi:hypothetical protein
VSRGRSNHVVDTRAWYVELMLIAPAHRHSDGVADADVAADERADERAAIVREPAMAKRRRRLGSPWTMGRAGFEPATLGLKVPCSAS